MTDHPRQAILDAMLSRLKTPVTPAIPASGGNPAQTATYRTDCGARVYTDRDKPVKADNCPMIIIHQGDERVTRRASDDQDTMARTVRIMVDVHVAVDAEQDRAANEIAWQVEGALWGLTELVNWSLSLAGSESFLTRERAEAERLIGVMRLQYDAEYQTCPPPEPPGVVPQEVYLGQAPDIGPPHVDDYLLIYPADPVEPPP